MAAQSTSGTKNIRIVIVVDDDHRVRESLEHLLHSAGLETESFDSAEGLLGSGPHRTCSCVISDIRMAGMDGWQLLRRLREQSPNLPVILISAYEDSQAAARAHVLGAFAFLLKPIDGEELLHLVERAMCR